MFSELTAALAKAKAASSSGAGAAVAGAPSGSEAGSPLDAAATATGSDQLGQLAAEQQQQHLVKEPAGLKRLDSETASAAEDAAAAADTSRQRQPPLAPLQLQRDAMEVDGGAAAAAAEQLGERDMQQHDAMGQDYDMQQEEQEDDEDDYEEQQHRSSVRKQRRLSQSASANSSLADANPSRRSGRQAAAAEAAAAAAATAAAVAAASHTPPRRSGRETKKRVVYVDGLPVLRDNLYGEEGEPSVWDKELAGEQRSLKTCVEFFACNMTHSCSVAGSSWRRHLALIMHAANMARVCCVYCVLTPATSALTRIGTYLNALLLLGLLADSPLQTSPTQSRATRHRCRCHQAQHTGSSSWSICGRLASRSRRSVRRAA
jgi:hypothetical protein